MTMPFRPPSLCALILLLSIDSAPSEELAWWHFEVVGTNIADRHATGHDGALRNMPAQIDDGTSGFSYDVPGTQLTATGWGKWETRLSLHFDGVNDYIEITNKLSTLCLTNDPSSFTLEMFIKLDTVQSNGERLVYAQDTNDLTFPYASIDTWFTSFGTPPRPACRTLDNQSTGGNFLFADEHDPAVLSVGKWHHLAFVKDTSNLTIYVDYQADGTLTWTGMVHAITNLSAFVIGNSAQSASYGFDGYLDDIRFSDEALDPADFTHVVGGLPPIILDGGLVHGLPVMLFSSDTNSLYEIGSLDPSDLPDPSAVWDAEGTVTGREFYTLWSSAEVHTQRVYRVGRKLP